MNYAKNKIDFGNETEILKSIKILKMHFRLSKGKIVH